MMAHRKLTLQQAVDYVGELCRDTISGFMENENRIPSWERDIDNDVAIYVKGLKDWIVGSLHWSFMTERYFGEAGMEVKKTRIVALFPKKRRTN